MGTAALRKRKMEVSIPTGCPAAGFQDRMLRRERIFQVLRGESEI
jgi:hypothetical protein